MQTRQIPVGNGRFEIEIAEWGDSDDYLLFLHGISGLHEDPVIVGLAQAGKHVIAPRHPGFGDESQTELDTIHDLVYVYLDLLDELGLHNLPIVGHSLGGMIAAELAATQPERFSSVSLISPMGFFHKENPTFDFFACTPSEMAAAFFLDPEGEAAQSAGDTGLRRLAQAGAESAEGEELIEIYVERSKTLATAAKYLWPLPDRGLKKRIHRISGPTQIVWGKQDKVVTIAYAQDFLDGIEGSSLTEIDNASHEILLEQPEAVLSALL